MKKLLKIVLFFLPFLLFSGSCKKSAESLNIQPIDHNLIMNSSFESVSGPSMDGWTFRDSTIFSFYPDAPVDGGRYSIILRPVWRGYFTFNAVITKVALPPDSGRYRLSFWGKRLLNGKGSLHLFIGTGNVDTMTATVTIPVVDTIWTFYSREIVVANQSSDSVVVALHGGYSPVGHPADSTFFDLCRFERLD